MRWLSGYSATMWAYVSCVVLLLSQQAAYAGKFTACEQQFYQQMPPSLLRDSLRPHTFPLCFNGFAVMYSGVSRTPLWSAEYLTPQRLKQARTLNRQGEFYEEGRVPGAYRSQLSHYARSGYDRGHMAPNGDMASRSQQADSFSLANMVPQTPYNNQEVWRNLEEATRALVLKKRTMAYVVTGPVFMGQRLKKIGGKQGVLVPSHVYKAVYFPELNAASAYVAVNDGRAALRIVSVAELERLAGINLFPAMPAASKQQLLNIPVTAKQANKATFDLWGSVDPQYTRALPVPDAASHQPEREQGQSSAEREQSLWQLLINRLLNWLVDLLMSSSKS